MLYIPVRLQYLYWCAINSEQVCILAIQCQCELINLADFHASLA